LTIHYWSRARHGVEIIGPFSAEKARYDIDYIKLTRADVSMRRNNMLGLVFQQVRKKTNGRIEGN